MVLLSCATCSSGVLGTQLAACQRRGLKLHRAWRLGFATRRQHRRSTHYRVGAALLSTAHLQQVWQDLLANLAADGAALDQRDHLRQRGRRQLQLGKRYARLLQAVTPGESVTCASPPSFV